jgi:uncharacterized membrane protein
MGNQKTHLVRDIEKDVKYDIKAAKKIPRLPWWAVLCLIIACILLAWLFDHFGRLNLALPVLDGIALLVFIIAVKWKLRRCVWFWITITAIAALHVLGILYVPWTTKWLPAAAIAGILCIDMCAVFVILAVVEKFVGKAENV